MNSTQVDTSPALRLSQVVGSFKLPMALTLAIFVLSFAPRIASNSTLMYSFWGASLVLLLWQGFMLIHLARRPALKDFSRAVYSQHYVQAMVQFSVYLYWGYYWRPVYDHLWLLAGQVMFAYTFGMLLAWSRRRSYMLGFGPIPIIFSTNLFLWFHDDWFYMQFVMIAVGFLGKEFVRWNRDGRSVHIFNPSAFSLGFFSLILITTGTTDLTWAPEISSTLTLAPGIYTYLFAVGLVVMYFFSITLVSGAAAITLFGFSALYAAIAGVPYFLDSDIPAAVFLGLHLLITDPSTSPRTPLGKTLFLTLTVRVVTSRARYARNIQRRLFLRVIERKSTSETLIVLSLFQLMIHRNTIIKDEAFAFPACRRLRCLFEVIQNAAF